MADRIGLHLGNIGFRIAQRAQGRWHGAVDDLEVTATGELLELDQRKVWLDAGGVAIHHQTDGPRRRNHRGLRVAVPVLFAKTQGFVPGRGGDVDQVGLRAVCVIQWHGLDR